MIIGPQVRRLVYEAVPYLSKYPDRLKCHVIDGKKIRIVQYTACANPLIDDFDEDGPKYGTIHSDENFARIIECLVHYGGIVITGKVTRPCEKYNGSKIINIPFKAA